MDETEGPVSYSIGLPTLLQDQTDNVDCILRGGDKDKTSAGGMSGGNVEAIRTVKNSSDSNKSKVSARQDTGA